MLSNWDYQGPDWTGPVYVSTSNTSSAYTLSGYVEIPKGWRGRLVRWLCR